jgi:hypothetical protein
MPSSIHEPTKQDADESDRKSQYSGVQPAKPFAADSNSLAPKTHATVVWSRGGAEFKRTLNLWAKQTFTRSGSLSRWRPRVRCRLNRVRTVGASGSRLWPGSLSPSASSARTSRRACGPGCCSIKWGRP